MRPLQILTLACLMLALCSSLTFAQSVALHGIDVTDLDRKADPLQRFLRVRQRYMADEQSDSSIDDALEQALGGGRILQG